MSIMRSLSRARLALIALSALIGLSLTSAAPADSGRIYITVIKAGWVVGGSLGRGELLFRGRRYPLSIGGLSYGFTFGASQIDFHGRVSNIRRPSDVEGVYAAGGAGATIGLGASAIVLTNQKGAVLQLSGRQIGLMANIDLSGMAITLR
jgi:hypothetical protein